MQDTKIQLDNFINSLIKEKNFTNLNIEASNKIGFN